MSRSMLAAFEVAAAHGCLVLRDSESDGDLSGWDPARQPWFVDQGAAIFAVLPGIDGMLRCEVWQDGAEEELQYELFVADFEIRGGAPGRGPRGGRDRRAPLGPGQPGGAGARGRRGLAHARAGGGDVSGRTR